MLRFLLDKFKESPGPFKDFRLIVADIAEELVDLALYYANQLVRHKPTAPASAPAEKPSVTPNTDSPNQPTKQKAAPKSDKPKKKRTTQAKKGVPPKNEPARSVDVPPILASALDKAANRKKQEFKVLAILWDAQNRNLNAMSAKEISGHGKLLGLLIRHENVRKVIRTRLEKYIDIITRENSSGSVYYYAIAESGMAYFESKYLNAEND
jgi:hypothetical protein